MKRSTWENVCGLAVTTMLLLGLLMVPPMAEAQSEVDYILIRDAPSGGGSVVDNRTYHTGDTDTFYAAGYNNTTGFVEDVAVYWDTEDWHSIEFDNYWGTSTNITAKEYGITRVRAFDNGTGGGPLLEAFTGNLTVISDIDYIILLDQPGGAGSWIGDRVVMTENGFYSYSAGYNVTSGYLRDVPVWWSSSNISLCSVQGSRYRYTWIYPYGEGMCKITGMYSPGVMNSTGLITVESDIDYVTIRDSSGGGGAPVGDVTYPIDATDYFYAAGYNLTMGYMRDVRASWSSNNVGVCMVNAWNSSSTSLTLVSDGFCRVTANYAWVAVNTTGIITVLFDIDYVVIRDASGGGGQPVTTRTFYVTKYYYFWAAGYNHTDGYRRDLTVYWTVSNSTVCIPGGGNPTKQFIIEAWAPGICIVSVNFKSRVTNATGDLNIVLDIDYVVIRDASGGGGNILGAKTLYTYVVYYFYAAGYNHSTGYKGDLDASWISSNNSICLFGHAGFRIWVEPQLPGTCVFTVDFRGLLFNATGILNVYTDIDYILIRDGPGGSGASIENRTYFTGESAAYHAAGYNKSTGYRRDLTVTWSSSNTTVCGVTYQGFMSFWAEGVCRITANFHSLVVNRTGNLTVEGDIDYLTIVDHRGGSGLPIGNRSYLLGSEADFFAAGYNSSLGYRRDLKPAWATTNATVCSISALPTHDGIRFRAVFVGMCRVTANYLSRVMNSTGDIIVYSEVDYVVIRDGPGGLGAWVGDQDYIVTTEHNFYAAGHNNSRGFLRDLGAAEVYWTTNNSAVCTITYQAGQIVFKGRSVGFCRVKVSYYGIVHNFTGTLHVVPRPVITVDDDGGKDYLTIHEAIESAVDGAIIRVYNGTYFEHLLVDKSVLIEGLDRSRTWVNGSGTGTIFRVTAKNARITGLTIESAVYGIILDHAEHATIDHNTIRLYTYGVYSDHSKYGRIEKNLVTRGSNGIVTHHSFNDAVWNNEISYNSVYGAKDYDSKLVNCFNWNYLHHNKVAYYYDPDLNLTPLLLDSNVFEDNEIGILIENSSSIYVTNNTVVRSEKGVVVMNGSPFLGNNSIADVNYGIELVNSSSYILGNSIRDAQIGISAFDGSPRIEGNVVLGAALALRLYEARNASVLNNDFSGGVAAIVNSTLYSLSIGNGTLKATNSTWVQLSVGGNATVEVMWWVRIQMLTYSGEPVQGARMSIIDTQGKVAASFFSDSLGLGPVLALTQERVNSSGSLDLNPYRLEVEVNSVSQEFEFIVDSSRVFVFSLKPSLIEEKPTPWLLYAIVVIALVSICLGASMSNERSRYALLSLFMPFYVRLKKEDIPDQFTRGRILGYIEANPGEHFKAILDALSLSNGNAIYHLRLLESEGFVTSKHDGTLKRFYPEGMSPPPDNSASLPEIRQRVLNCIRESPGIAQKEITGLLGTRQSTLEYQVQKLVEAGFVRREKSGRRAPLYPVEDGKK